MTLVLAALLMAAVACGGGADGVSDATDSAELQTWNSSFEPGIEVRGDVQIVRLKGTPYEMGRQHAEFLREELIEGAAFIDSSYLLLLEQIGEEHGFIAEAEAQSFSDILEECRGLSDVLGNDGWPLSRCLALAYGDIIMASVEAGLLACSQFVAAGTATGGGELIHGRNLDWSNIDFMLKYPVLFVRHPEGKIPYVTVGFPGSVATYNGMNAAGLSLATNMNSTKNDMDRVGRSEVQIVNEILSTASSLDEAKSIVAATDHMAAVIMTMADGDRNVATVAEITATHLAFRDLNSDGVVYATNHFMDPTMVDWGVPAGPEDSSTARYQRLQDLLTPGGEDSVYGSVDVATGVSILRDGHNPITGKDVPSTQFDDGKTIANNACVYSMVFAPKRRTIYLALGGYPVPTGTYKGFSLDELLGNSGLAPEPAEVP